MHSLLRPRLARNCSSHALGLAYACSETGSASAYLSLSEQRM